MLCITSLPDGTFLILNGALQGVAGFGLASDPNLGAVLYDPTQPIGSRMSILNNTIISRQYHSEATLLPDGRILVSGSDPQTNFPNSTIEYPEEFRNGLTSHFISFLFLNADPNWHSSRFIFLLILLKDSPSPHLLFLWPTGPMENNIRSWMWISSKVQASESPLLRVNFDFFFFYKRRFFFS